MSSVPRHLPSLIAALLATVLAWSAGAQTAAADTQPGTITGKVRGSLPPSKKGVVTVRAINAQSGAVEDLAAVSKRRTFTLVVQPGVYAVRMTVTEPGHAASEQTTQVSVGDGQKRAGLSFAISAAKAARASASSAREPTATRAYVNADGTQVAGVTAYALEGFTGGTKDWKDIRSSLATAMQVDASDSVGCSAQLSASGPERRSLQRLSFKASKYVAKGIQLNRNFIVGDVAVGGKIKASRSGTSATITVTFVDKRTGKTFDTVKATLKKSNFASNERALAKVVGERLCRRPASYKVVLADNGSADFSGHSATGRLDSTLLATATGGSGGQPDATYTGKGDIAWTNLVFTSKKGCTFTDPRPAKGQWTATVTSGADGQLTVDWGPSGALYFAASTATVNCPGVRAQSGQPGPSLVGLLPNATKLPSSGGTLQVSGAISLLDYTFNNAGTLKITPVWKYKAP